ncbi:TonB-dependent receptor domain-containing protein [Iodobacter fluviatilis]|uniref:Outer membrane cobalamin translocator n=1 Tax=Iodobacter fluviatilis TaxID=537 RepID=A0A377SVL2_9NEIS|nr:TonB-dependent receptor [Iodobacter fluviatilis]TCU87867.1 vitamin B12 transporter [Iodobacter fluviatilis]STR45368.1 Outer membrane cobalamin translocator [Iodobacter fluviatilis]
MLFRIAPLSLLIASICAQAEVVQLPAVVTTAARLPQAAKEVIGDVTVIDQKTIEAAGTVSLPELLARQPGVQITSNGGAGKSGGIFIRGSSSQQAVYLIDGIRFGSATAGAAALQHIPLAQIERIEILRGPAASLYGSDAIGGVIQIFTRQGDKGFHPSVEVGFGTENTQTTSAHLSGGEDGTRYAIGLAHSKTDGISARSNPKAGTMSTDTDGYENTSLSINASHRINEAHEFGASLLQAKVENHYDSSVSSNYDDRDDGTNGSATFWMNNRFTKNWTSKLQAGVSIDDSTNYTRAGESRFKTKQTQISWLNEIKVGPGIMTVGAETLEQAISSTTKFDVDQRRINSLLAGYLAHFDDIALQVNLRNDNNSQFGDNTNGSIGASWQLADAWKVGGSFGTGYRAPTFNQLYYPNYGTPTLQPETSKNTEVFVRFEANNIQLSATAYHNEIDGMLETGKTTTTVIGNAKLKGITFTADWQGEMFQAGGSFDLLDAKDTSGGGSTDGKQLTRRAKQFGSAYVGVAQGQWSARGEVQAQAHREEDIYGGPRARLAGYALANLSVNWQFAKDWQASARVNNVFDTEYELAKDYATLGRNAMLNLRWQH